MSKPPSKKSILANFDQFVTAPPPSPATGSASAPAPAPRSRVGAGVIGAASRAISDIREERDRLQALVEAGGGGAVDLDPNLVDPSPFPDRLPDDGDAPFAAFKRAFEAEGQKVPIQVRRHPTLDGRFQVIYGHRRLRAARELGRPVKALVLEMTDRDLVVAQGIENGARQDLSWIERALFAQTMDEAGIKPRDIYAALGIDDAELARMRAVYKAVPDDIIKRVGRAPRVGRPRWGALVKLMASTAGAPAAIRRTLSGDRVLAMPSDQRFARALGALKGGSERATPEEVSLAGADGSSVGKAMFNGREVRLVLDKARAADLADFLRAELPALMERFSASDGDTEHPATPENPVS